MQATIHIILDDKDSIDITLFANKIRYESAKPEPFPSPESIIAETARYYELSYDDLIGYDRECNKTNAQCIAMYLIRKLTNFSLRKTGELFNCDYSRVKSSLCHVEAKMRDNPEFTREINSIITEVKERS